MTSKRTEHNNERLLILFYEHTIVVIYVMKQISFKADMIAL